jgi:hypothetical protein
LAPARGWLTRHAIPALRNGLTRRGHGKTSGNSIRGQSRRQQLHLGSERVFNRTVGQPLGLEVTK